MFDSNCNEWEKATNIKELVASAAKKPGFVVAKKMIEACAPLMQIFGSGMIGDVGDITHFVQVTVDEKTNVSACLHVSQEAYEKGSQEACKQGSQEASTESDIADTVRFECYGDYAKEFLAAFTIDHPNANFLYLDKDGTPQRLFLMTKSTIPGRSDDASVVCFSNLKHLFEKGIRDFSFAYGK